MTFIAAKNNSELSQPSTQAEAADEKPAICYAACLGALGLFGNGVFQLIACKLLADRAGLDLALPAGWPYASFFPAVAQLATLSPVQAYALPIVADRVVLSHPGFRAWALQHSTSLQLARKLGLHETPGAAPVASLQVETQGPLSPALSGRQLRKHFPQVCGDDLMADPLELRARIRGKGLWGWFQFHTRVLAPHRPAIRALLALPRDTEASLRAALAAALRLAGKRRVVAVHLRKGDFCDLQELQQQQQQWQGGDPAGEQSGAEQQQQQQRQRQGEGPAGEQPGAEQQQDNDDPPQRHHHQQQQQQHHPGRHRHDSTHHTQGVQHTAEQAVQLAGSPPRQLQLLQQATSGPHGRAPRAKTPPPGAAKAGGRRCSNSLGGRHTSPPPPPAPPPRLPRLSRPGAAFRAAAPGGLSHISKGGFEVAGGGCGSGSGGRHRAGLRCEPPFEDGQGQAWEDHSGANFRAPVQWFEEVLERVLLAPLPVAFGLGRGSLRVNAEAEQVRPPSQGAEGSTPSQGAEGSTPSHGATGLTASQGAEGSTPSQGAEGSTPSHGATGLTASQGAEGSTPPQVAVGSTSSQGAARSTPAAAAAMEPREGCTTAADAGGSGDDVAALPGAPPPAPRNADAKQRAQAVMDSNEHITLTAAAGSGHACMSTCHSSSDAMLFLCTDDARLAADPRVGRHAAHSWASLLPLLQREDAGAAEVLRRHPLLADWYVMRQAGALLASNSTLSFSAALCNEVEGARFWRPDPRRHEMVEFDPWDALPLLPALEVPANHSLHVAA